MAKAIHATRFPGETEQYREARNRLLEEEIDLRRKRMERFREHGERRGWRHALLLSSAGNTFNRDYRAEEESGQQWPLAHVFARRGDKIHHTWSSELWFAETDPGQDRRHVDFMWPMWNIFDTTPDGRGTEWGPKLGY